MLYNYFRRHNLKTIIFFMTICALNKEKGMDVIMANLNSEQLRSDLSLDINKDQPLSTTEMIKTIKNILGEENCYIGKYNNKKFLCYKHGVITEVLLLAAVTYMGGNGQHPIYKKRMQLKNWYKDIVNQYSDNPKYNVRFIGVYHYQNNIIFVEFLKDTYINKKMNSSAAHVYTNDLYQAMKDGIFKRKDRNKNEIITIKYIKFKDYLDNLMKVYNNDLFNVFALFNEGDYFGKWISAKNAIPEMHTNSWDKWKETEWPGWYLEFKMNLFIKEKCLENKILYVGSSHKRAGELDFDLWFGEDNFYGDLKASDITKKEAPGNDQQSFIECINKYDKFWYIIYEHDTIKDSESNNFEATRFRTNYIKDNNEWPRNKQFDELSYHKRMKNSVKFVKMYILELNRINFRNILSDFNQGKQPNGDPRNPKFKISKNNIDNFIVYEQEFIQIEDTE